MILSKGLLFGIAGSLVLGATSASADVLAQYNFPGGSAASSDVHPTTASDVQIGDFLNDNNDGDGGPGIDVLGTFVRAEDTEDPASLGGAIVTLGDAILSNDYYYFTLTGASYSISQISFDYTVSASGTTTSFAADLLTSATGLTGSDSLSETPVTTSSNGVATNVVVPLGGNASLQGLSGTTEFRIYVRDNQAGNAQSHRLNNIVVEGTPEPGSLALLAIGGFFVSWRKRRA